ncbi:MAG TPA: nucleoside triphosphate pyrophosphatase [Candidatus Krumholzibacteria bacterium]|nr:nucleoside triphosphate pyrophosphatase [Candidatus Krumholzibacteria bacterium]
MSPNAPTRPLILASTSRYRLSLLQRFGLTFTPHNPNVDETERHGESPRARAFRLSEAKAEAVAAQFPQAIVVGGDQVPATSTTILNKPGNAANCREQLKLLSQSNADFYTAAAVRCVATGLKLGHVDTTIVRLRTLNDAEIDRYIEREKPFDCAGGFKAEALGITLFERMDSEDPTAIVGMPLIWLAGALRTAGYTIP